MPAPLEPYIPISFPESLVERVDALVQIPEMGFKTRAEFARTALRLFLEDREKNVYRSLVLRGILPSAPKRSRSMRQHLTENKKKAKKA